MFDDVDAREKDNDGLGYRPGARPTPVVRETAPPADREVPIPATPAAELAHRWLDDDGKVSVMRASSGGDETVDMWNRIHDEAETLRSRTTPLHVHKRIMESLPDDAYRLQQPWYRRGVSLNPVLLVLVAAALVVLGGVLAHVAFR